MQSTDILRQNVRQDRLCAFLKFRRGDLHSLAQTPGGLEVGLSWSVANQAVAECGVRLVSMTGLGPKRQPGVIQRWWSIVEVAKSSIDLKSSFQWVLGVFFEVLFYRKGWYIIEIGAGHTAHDYPGCLLTSKAVRLCGRHLLGSLYNISIA